MTYTNVPCRPRQVGRRAVLATLAGVPVAVLASPAAHALPPTPALLGALRNLEAARAALDVAASCNQAAVASVDKWERDNPPPSSKRGRKRWERRSSVVYHALTDRPWQVLMAAETSFRAAQDAVVAIECGGPAHLQLLLEAAVTHDAVELRSTNRAPLSKAVARYLNEVRP